MPRVGGAGVRGRPGGRGPAPQPPPRALRGAAVSELSLVAAFDDLTRNAKVLKEGGESEFLKFVKLTIDWKKRFCHAEQEIQRLHHLLNDKENKLSANQYKIKQARRMVEDERRGRLAAEADREHFVKQLDSIKDFLLVDGGRPGFDNETLERVRHIDTTRRQSPFKDKNNALMPTLEESVDSILDADDYSFDETGGDILGGGGESRRLSHKRRSSCRFEQAQRRKKSRSIGNKLEMTPPANGEVLQATTRMTIDAQGNAQAEAVLESIPMHNMSMKAARKSMDTNPTTATRRVTYSENPAEAMEFEPSAPPANNQPQHGHFSRQTGAQVSPAVSVRRHFSNANSIPNRPHCFVEKKAMVNSGKCGVCNTRFQFRQLLIRCRNCSATAHPNCRSEVPLPCVPINSGSTPTKQAGGLLANYAPITPPMVPALIIHCVQEVEARGMNEVGLYRIPGSETESHDIVDKFLRAKNGVPIISKYDVHVIASAVKKFLRSLKEPVIPAAQWRQFVEAANNPDTTSRESAMLQAVTELPRPNRDTLAFLVLHLQKVAESAATKMPITNLARVFAPTIIGHSCNDPMVMATEIPLQEATMRMLLNMSSDYWGGFIQIESESLFPPYGGTRSTPEHHGRHNAVFQTPLQSAIARRTRSRLSKVPKTPKYFQSPMLN